MLKNTESRLKFFIKMRAVTPIRSLLLFITRFKVNKNNWDNRILLINLEAMGDLVMFTSVLKHYKQAFLGKKIYLLIKSGTGMKKILENNFVDEVIELNYRKFISNPFYGAMFVNNLKKIGFRKIVNHDFSAAEIFGKMISISLEAEEVLGYEGQDIEFRKPFDYQQMKNLEISRKRILPKFTKLIPSVKTNPEEEGYLPSEIEYYRLIYEIVSGKKERDYSTFLPDSESNLTEKFHLKNEKYVVLNVNSSNRVKCWPLERFSEVSKYLSDRGLKLVLIGSPGEVEWVKKFELISGLPLINLAGKTTFPELLQLIRESFMVFTNDTSTVHLAVAMKKPSLCVVGGGQFGVAVDYGYEDINRWVYSKTQCFFDNWRCSRVERDRPSPCVDAVKSKDVLNSARELVDYLLSEKNYPKYEFTIRFNK